MPPTTPHYPTLHYPIPRQGRGSSGSRALSPPRHPLWCPRGCPQHLGRRRGLGNPSGRDCEGLSRISRSAGPGVGVGGCRWRVGANGKTPPSSVSPQPQLMTPEGCRRFDGTQSSVWGTSGFCDGGRLSGCLIQAHWG